MRPRLLRVVANTIAVFAVFAALLGSGIALLLSVYTHYVAEAWHFILVGCVALGLIVLAAVLHFVTRVYERRRVIRDSWEIVKDADTLDPDEDPAVDPDMIAARTLDELTREVMEEMQEEMPAYRRKQFKKKLRIALGAVAVAVPVALTGALLAMQKKLRVKEPSVSCAEKADLES
ncbi:MAG: hypothetical protein E7643_08905 [Ruminococcaceae bacterium]|nr:hypothetical protein [Oscillospiraceae bacterium]